MRHIHISIINCYMGVLVKEINKNRGEINGKNRKSKKGIRGNS